MLFKMHGDISLTAYEGGGALTDLFRVPTIPLTLTLHGSSFESGTETGGGGGEGREGVERGRLVARLGKDAFMYMVHERRLGGSHFPRTTGEGE